MEHVMTVMALLVMGQWWTHTTPSHEADIASYTIHAIFMTSWKYRKSVNNGSYTICQKFRCENVWKLQDCFYVRVKLFFVRLWWWMGYASISINLNWRESREYSITKGHHTREISRAVRPNEGHVDCCLHSWHTLSPLKLW
jgi:hypothetical protein